MGQTHAVQLQQVSSGGKGEARHGHSCASEQLEGLSIVIVTASAAADRRQCLLNRHGRQNDLILV
jgi:hypothetical protein